MGNTKFIKKIIICYFTSVLLIMLLTLWIIGNFKFSFTHVIIAMFFSSVITTLLIVYPKMIIDRNNALNNK